MEPSIEHTNTQNYLKNRFLTTNNTTKLEDSKIINSNAPSQHENDTHEQKHTPSAKLAEIEAYPRPTNSTLPIKCGGIKYYSKPKGANAPSSISSYTSIDEGNAPCRYARPTCTTLSKNPHFYCGSMFPVGIVYTPLADPGEIEQDIQL